MFPVVYFGTIICRICEPFSRQLLAFRRAARSGFSLGVHSETSVSQLPCAFPSVSHLFRLVFEFVLVLARTFSTPVRVAPVAIWFQVVNEAQLRSGRYFPFVHHFFPLLCVPFP
jgi:hypothetical protein